MSIHKKLIISHVLMLFIPVFLALTCFIISFKTYGNQYWESMEEMFKDENGIYSAQSIIYAYRNSLLNQSSSDAGEKNISNLENALAEMNYHVRIQIDDQMIFDSLTDADEETLKQYIAPSHDFPGNLTLSDGGCSIIRNSFETEDGLCEITAVHPDKHTAPDAQATFFQKYILMFFLVLSLFTSAAIILTNTILSHHVSRMILEPLNILKTGTREIADGNLDWELTYQKPDEFGDVCREFDRMRGQLKKSVETQLQYEENRRELIAGISHDLRTPLTSIKGYVEGLQDGIANTSEKQARYYEAIHMRALDMEALVDSLSLFNRLESKNYHYHLEPVDMAARISRLLENYEEDARQKGLLIFLDNRASRTLVAIDIKEMHRVFMNLFENSVKYRTGNQSVIHITLEDHDNVLEIRIADNGPGVPEEDLPHIFTSFYRGDKSRTRPEMGSGLGLSIARQIIEGHQGTITAFNDNGFVICITLPLHDSTKKENRNEENTDYRG